MALDYEIENDGTTYDWAAVGRAAQSKEMTPTYEGVGDAELAEPDLDCGVAQLAGELAVGAGELGARHPLEP